MNMQAWQERHSLPLPEFYVFRMRCPTLPVGT